MSECVQEITINGIKYTPNIPNNSPVKICILQRGWVAVGNFSREGNDCTLNNASIIRIWGTTKGLGELALNGPTSSTKLDPCGTLHFDYLTTVAVLDCNMEKWK